MKSINLLLSFVIGLFIGGAITYFLCEHLTGPDVPSLIGISERIENDRANTLRNNYQNSLNPLYVKYTNNDGIDVVEILNGFVFNAVHLREILIDNHSPAGNPDKVVFYLGQDGTFTDPRNPQINHPNINLIAIGALDNRLLTDTRTGFSASLFDKADPCPPNCPR